MRFNQLHVCGTTECIQIYAVAPPVKLLALLGTIRRRMCFALFTARAFLRDPQAAKVAEAALVDS